MNHEIEKHLLALLSTQCQSQTDVDRFLTETNQQVSKAYDLPISAEEAADLLVAVPAPLRTPLNLATLWLDQIKELLGEQPQVQSPMPDKMQQSSAAIESLIPPKSVIVTSPQPASPISVPVETSVAGVTYDGRQAVIPTLKAYQLCVLRREPNNPYDKNAIAVWTQDNRSIGFIPGPLAARLAPLFDKMVQMPTARVLRVTGGGYNRSYGVVIKIETADVVSQPPVHDNHMVPMHEHLQIQVEDMEMDDLDGTFHSVKSRSVHWQILSQLVSVTEEQRQVIEHPVGKHARILAVAGSGKTTTMAHRLKHLIDQGYHPDTMLVLMFNRLAREQFQNKLEQIGIPAQNAPKVRTFHALAYNFLSDLKKYGLISPEFDMWTGDKEELARRYVHRAIESLVKDEIIEPDQIDVEDAMTAISLWKGSLIPPERAGYRNEPAMPVVYQRFEALRSEKLGLTFDDLVPLAVQFLQSDDTMRRRWCNRLKFLIVDEYQDVNYGQQRLIELLAGDGPGGADIMVVGDDDQTIYEWRGARPEYIIREFKARFGNKPMVDYKLTNSFRFGCQIAQAAYHVIDWNTNRVPKRLISHNPRAEALIHIVDNATGQPSEVDFALANEVISLVKDQNVPPTNLIVLGRTFTQTSSMQAAFLVHSVPFKVIGQAPFFERNENTILLDYLRLAYTLDMPCQNETERQFLHVANTPNRYLTRIQLESAVKVGIQRRYSLRKVLTLLADPSETPFRSDMRKRAEELQQFMERLHERLTTEPNVKAGKLLQWMVQALNYNQHFENYYGKGEKSDERLSSIDHFIAYAERINLSPMAFVQHVERLDSTLGMPDEKLIEITTIHRTKGLEYDYVFIPSLQEGYMPCLYGSEISVYDKQGIVKEPDPSETIENERRLCYVAITRAKKAVYIGVNYPPIGGNQTESSVKLPSRFLDEMELPAVRPLTDALHQALTTGREQYRLVELAHEHRNNYKLLGTLQDAYLRHILNEGLRQTLQSIPPSTAERPFVYSYPYKSIVAKQSKQDQPEEDVWSHIQIRS